MSIYFKADQATVNLVGDAVRTWHPELRKAQIIVGVLFAVSNKEGQAAIKEAGHEVDGIIKIVPLKDRVSKGFDVEMILDGDSWKQKGEKYNIAFVDHLLSRLELKKPKSKKSKNEKASDESEAQEEAEYMQDDIGRPVLKIS